MLNFAEWPTKFNQ